MICRLCNLPVVSCKVDECEFMYNCELKKGKVLKNESRDNTCFNEL